MAQHRPADPPEMPPLQRKLQQAMFGGDQPDLAAIESIKQEIVAAEARMLDTRIATEMEIAKILTPEQKQRLLDLPPPMGRGGPGRMMGGRGRVGRGMGGAIR
jgi:Spy/CpxP family protein refolding chaperone